MLAAAVVGLAWFATTPASARAAVRPKEEKYAEIWDLARVVEQKAQMPGFAAFALAVATSESRGYHLAANTSESEAAAACRGYERYPAKFAGNPYGRDRFCFGGGGWFGFLPSTALSAPSFANQDPYLVFNKAASVALLADYVRRVKKGFFHKLPPSCRNWLTIRRFMASNKIGMDCYETNYGKSAKVRVKLAKNLRQRGMPVSLMQRNVVIGNWPGDWALYQLLAGFEAEQAPAMPEDKS